MELVEAARASVAGVTTILESLLAAGYIRTEIRLEFDKPPEQPKPFKAGAMWLYGEESLPGLQVEEAEDQRAGEPEQRGRERDAHAAERIVDVRGVAGHEQPPVAIA